MTSEEYRIEVIERLKACWSPAHPRTSLDQVDGFLSQSGFSRQAQQTFWATLHNDLDVVAQDSTLLLGPKAAATLTAVVAAAQTEIARYRLMMARDERAPGT